ncbi:MAG: HEAT repeat domain-containing protein [Syntrophomonadaceae bacterium]|nr:HEAT repeat domain-containing protein [Syntrophomonadaceae bacterium]
MKYYQMESIQAKKLPLDFQQHLYQGLELLLLDEWGGPKSKLAQIYIKDIIIPDLVNSLLINYAFIQNRIFASILANKFQTQYGYPEAFAQGVSGEILSFAGRLLAQHQIAYPATSLWDPWERLFKLLSLGENISVIAKKTGYSEDYVELVRNKYLRFTNHCGHEPIDIPGDSFIADELTRFMRAFSSRFENRKDYMQILLAEQLIFDGNLPLSPEAILDIFIAVHNWDGALNITELYSRLKRNSINFGYNKQNEFKRLNMRGFSQTLSFLYDKRYLTCDTERGQKICLAANGAKLVASLICPHVKEEILQIIISSVPDRFKKAAAIITSLNPEVIVHLLELLVNANNNEVIHLLYYLPLNKNKQLYLKALWACGKIKSISAMDLLVGALNHKDGLIRAKACEALGLLGDKSTYFLLIKCLKDPLNLVREQALMALGNLKLISSLKHIEEILSIEEDYRVRSVARDVREKIIKACPVKK